MAYQFIEADESNVLIDNLAHDGSDPSNISVPIPVDSLKRLRDIGVQTALEFCPWKMIEPQYGVYDWTIPDEQATRLRAGGMKALLMLPSAVPTWMPDQWYVQTKEGRALKQSGPPDPIRVWGCLSPWSAEAQDYQNAFIAMCCKRYNAPDVLCIQSHSMDGESVLPPRLPAVYDPAALDSYARFTGDRLAMPDVSNPNTQAWMLQSLKEVIVSQAKIYCESHPSRTCFLQLHPAYSSARWPASATANIVEYWQAIQQEVKPDNKFHLLFTAFDGGHSSLSTIRQLQAMSIPVLCGGEWCAGLYENTDKAIALGIRALLTAPTHPFLHKAAMVESDFQAFEYSRKRFMAARYSP